MRGDYQVFRTCFYLQVQARWYWHVEVTPDDETWPRWVQGWAMTRRRAMREVHRHGGTRQVHPSEVTP